jgi:excisionase family DNA binding protein
LIVPNRPRKNRADHPQPLAYTPHELRAQLGLGRDKIYTLIRSGELRSIRVDRRWLVPADAVTDFLKGKK